MKKSLPRGIESSPAPRWERMNLIDAIKLIEQAETEEERAVATLRVLKDRFTGDSIGKTQRLMYNRFPLNAQRNYTT